MPRAYAAHLRNDKPLAVGDKLGVRLDGQNVLAMRGLDLVAVFKNPTTELKSALSASFGEEGGLRLLSSSGENVARRHYIDGDQTIVVKRTNGRIALAALA